MASAKFLEEALSTDVDESAVSAIVGSLEDQLGTATPTIINHTAAGAVTLTPNHINSAIANGGTTTTTTGPLVGASQKQQQHGVALANGDTVALSGAVSAVPAADAVKLVAGSNNAIISGAAAAQTAPATIPNVGHHNNNAIASGAKVLLTQPSPANSRPIVSSLPNGLSPSQPPHINNAQVKQQQQQQPPPQQQQQQPTLVIKTSGAPTGAPGLVTVPMNVTASVPQVSNVVNVRPGVATAAATSAANAHKGQTTTRVVLSAAPQMVGARTGAPQLTLQSLQGLQPGQQGHLLLKTENGQYQLLRVGPAPTVPGALAPNSAAGASPITFRMQTVPAAVSRLNVQFAGAPLTPQNQIQGATTAPATTPANVTTVQSSTTPITTTQRPANDNTKEKCRKFLANLLDLSSREPKTVERSVRTLIQELIDMRVEPEDFCDRLERLLNASPQPCLIGFLKKSLPLLRQSLATKELSIDGIRPPPSNVVFSIVSGTPTVQTQVRPTIATSQVRLVSPGTTVVRPGHVVQQRLITPARGATVPQAARMVTTIRQPNATTPVIVSNSQPPALHPVYPGGNQVRGGVNLVRQPLQVRTVTPGQLRSPMAIRTTAPAQIRPPSSGSKLHGSKPMVPSLMSKAATKDKEKKTFSSAYTGDDDINDVAAMGGVNLAEETQRILGSTEFVGTQIRSCKEEFLLNTTALQQRLRATSARNELDEPSNEVAAVISHAFQERLKNMLEKLTIITEHRLEIVKSDPHHEITSDIKGQLKFLEDIDRAERKRHEEVMREILLRAAKSRSKTEDPEQAKLKAKAKEMQRVEMEELRQREANATALQAIGPRKKPRLDGDNSVGTSQASAGGLNSSSRGQPPLRARMKKVTLKDLQSLFESEKDLCKSEILYKSFLK